jgi:hypothetical protein
MLGASWFAVRVGVGHKDSPAALMSFAAWCSVHLNRPDAEIKLLQFVRGTFIVDAIDVLSNDPNGSDLLNDPSHFGP